MNVEELHRDNQQLKCSGCGACVAACRGNKISMKLTTEGYFEPKVNEECNLCGVCTQICFGNTRQELFNYTEGRKYYAYLLDKEALAKSASGGVAQALTQFAISRGWGVFGTVYDSTTHTARAVYTHRIEDVKKMCGSKYIPSNTEMAMRECIEDTSSTVLFIGTPCMCYSMRNLAKKLHRLDKFYFVDFVCHGVPSLNLWTRHIRDLERKKGKINHVNFRSKIKGWHNKGIEFTFEDGKKFFSSRENDDFMKLYDASFLMNDSCFECNINNGFGCADIRLGDYWGSQFANNRTGVSRCSVATEKGTYLFDCIKNMLVYGETPELEYKDDNTYYMLARKNDKLKKEVLMKLNTGENLRYLYKVYRRSIPIKRRIFSKMPKMLRKLYSKFSRRIRSYGK